MLIQALQFACALLWSIACAVLASSAIRVWRGRASKRDEYRGALFMTGLIFIGGSSRWLLLPGDTSSWIAIYMGACAIPVYVLLLMRRTGDE